MNRQALRTPTEASAAPCADCVRLFDRAVALPDIYAKPAPELMALARGATHERALREGISHDAAGLVVYWQGFSTYRVMLGALGKDGVPSHP